MEMTLNLKLDASDKFLKAVNMIGTAIVAAKMDKLPWEEEETTTETQAQPKTAGAQAQPKTAGAQTQPKTAGAQTQPKMVKVQPKTADAPVDDLPFGDPSDTSGEAEGTEATSGNAEGTEATSGNAEGTVVKVEPEKAYGKVEIRAAMQEVRNRIEYPNGGDEYDESLHKQLTKQFKEIANRIEEGKKPTELTGENAKAFIEGCEGIHLEDGKVCPF